MYTIYFKESETIENTFYLLSNWKQEVFSIMENKVKAYFSEKVIVYFDNYMLFNKQRDFHDNLMEALANSSRDMHNVQNIFKKIHLKWIVEENNHFILISGLDDDLEYTILNYGFSLLEKNVDIITHKDEQLNYNAWTTLVFDSELVNFSQNWIDFIPELELRCQLQAKFILLNNQFTKHEMSLMEKIKFEENIESHPLYKQLYEKIVRIMPKIEQSLQEEYKHNLKFIKEKTEEIVLQQENRRKPKI